MEAPPVRYRVSIVPTQAITAKATPKVVTFALALIGSDSPPYQFDVRVSEKNLDCLLALIRLKSIVVEANEDIATHKANWQAKLISAALRGSLPK